MFNWIRQSIKNAILGGFADAIDEIKREPVPMFADAGEGYRNRLSLPAPEEEKRKAVRVK